MHILLNTLSDNNLNPINPNPPPIGDFSFV